MINSTDKSPLRARPGATSWYAHAPVALERGCADHFDRSSTTVWRYKIVDAQGESHFLEDLAVDVAPGGVDVPLHRGDTMTLDLSYAGGDWNDFPQPFA